MSRPVISHPVGARPVNGSMPSLLSSMRLTSAPLPAGYAQTAKREVCSQPLSPSVARPLTLGQPQPVKREVYSQPLTPSVARPLAKLEPVTLGYGEQVKGTT